MTLFSSLFRRARASSGVSPRSATTSFFPSVFDTPELPGYELYFDSDGWVRTDDDDIVVEHRPFKALYWKGMHPRITREYGDKLVGTTTHYTALGDGRQTATRFHNHDKWKTHWDSWKKAKQTAYVQEHGKRPYRGVSTHFIICRDGAVIQLASIEGRTWHAARKGLIFTVPAARGNPQTQSSNPNHWFVGVDLANWGKLQGTQSKGYKTWTGRPFSGPVFLDDKERGWEAYPQVQVESYISLMAAIVRELDQPPIECHVRHSDIDPKRKIDPGPAFPFRASILDIYTDDEEPTYFEERMGEEVSI